MRRCESRVFHGTNVCAGGWRTRFGGYGGRTTRPDSALAGIDLEDQAHGFSLCSALPVPERLRCPIGDQFSRVEASCVVNLGVANRAPIERDRVRTVKSMHDNAPALPTLEPEARNVINAKMKHACSQGGPSLFS